MKKIILLCALISTFAFANKSPDPFNNSDDALLCSFYAVVASNYMPTASTIESWRKNGNQWLEKAYELGADRNKDPDVIDEAITELGAMPEDQLMSMSVSLYKAKNYFV